MGRNKGGRGHSTTGRDSDTPSASRGGRGRGRGTGDSPPVVSSTPDTNVSESLDPAEDVSTPAAPVMPNPAVAPSISSLAAPSTTSAVPAVGARPMTRLPDGCRWITVADHMYIMNCILLLLLKVYGFNLIIFVVIQFAGFFHLRSALKR